MKILKSDLIVCFLLLLLAIVFTYIVENLNVQYYQLLILITYVLAVLYSMKKDFVIITLFLFSLFIFQYGRLVLLPLLFNKEITISWFRYYEFSQETVKFIYKILFYNILGILFGMLLFKSTKISKIYKKKELSPKTKQIFFYILIICFVFFIINNFLFLKIFYSYGGYLNYYLGVEIPKVNIFIRITSAVFYPLLIILLAYYHENKKDKYLLYFLFFSTNFIFSLKGARSPLFSSVFILFYLNVKKFKIKNLIVIFCCCSCLIMSLGFFSNIRREEIEKNFGIKERVNEFILSQGITGSFIGLLKDKPELFERKVPYIFSSILGKKINSREDKNILLPGNINLDTQMSARSNYSMFKNGYGMGGNYIIEMYDLGKTFGILILSFIHTYLSLYFFQNLNKFNYYFKVLLFFVLDYYFLIPRASYFPNIFNIKLGYIVFIYLIILIIDKFFKRKRC